jgi:hypothetical protein
MLVFLSVDRLHLLVALVAALTGTWWGFVLAAAVLSALALRCRARRSSAAGARVLTAAQRADPLHPTGHLGKATAQP